MKHTFPRLFPQCLHVTGTGGVRPTAFIEYEMTAEGPYYRRGEDVGKTTPIPTNSAALFAQTTK